MHVHVTDVDQSEGKRKHELAFSREKYDISLTIKNDQEDNTGRYPKSYESTEKLVSVIMTILTHKIGISGWKTCHKVFRYMPKCKHRFSGS